MTSFDPARSAPGSSCADHVPGSSRSSVLVTARIVPFTATASVEEAGLPCRSSRRPSSLSGSTGAERSTCCSACGSRSSTSIGAPTGSPDTAGAGCPRRARGAPEGTGETLPSNRLQRRATDSIRALASASASIVHLARGAQVAHHLAGGKAGAVHGGGSIDRRSEMNVQPLASVGRKSIACTLRSSMRPAALARLLDEERHPGDVSHCDPVDAPEGASGPEARPVIGGDHDERAIEESLGWSAAATRARRVRRHTRPAAGGAGRPGRPATPRISTGPGVSVPAGRSQS